MVEVALAITAGLALLAVVAAVARWVSLRGATRELVSARDELRVILEAVADGITAQDTSGRLVYVNDAAVRRWDSTAPQSFCAHQPASF